MPLEDLVDMEEERKRLEEEKTRLESEVARCEKMLSNPGFVNKAPEKKIQEEKDKLEKYKEMLAKVIERLKWDIGDGDIGDVENLFHNYVKNSCKMSNEYNIE